MQIPEIRTSCGPTGRRRHASRVRGEWARGLAARLLQIRESGFEQKVWYAKGNSPNESRLSVGEIEIAVRLINA